MSLVLGGHLYLFHPLSLGRVLRTTLPTAQGGVVHLFVVYGYQGAEEDAEKLRLTDRLLQAVLAEAQVSVLVSLCLLLVI